MTGSASPPFLLRLTWWSRRRCAFAQPAEILRIACMLATEAGIEVCMPVHDAEAEGMGARRTTHRRSGGLHLESDGRRQTAGSSVPRSTRLNLESRPRAAFLLGGLDAGCRSLGRLKHPGMPGGPFQRRFDLLLCLFNSEVNAVKRRGFIIIVGAAVAWPAACACRVTGDAGDRLPRKLFVNPCCAHFEFRPAQGMSP
jgi:hypothetical protein